MQSASLANGPANDVGLRNDANSNVAWRSNFAGIYNGASSLNQSGGVPLDGTTSTGTGAADGDVPSSSDLNAHKRGESQCKNEDDVKEEKKEKNKKKRSPKSEERKRLERRRRNLKRTADQDPAPSCIYHPKIEGTQSAEKKASDASHESTGPDESNHCGESNGSGESKSSEESNHSDQSTGCDESTFSDESKERQSEQQQPEFRATFDYAYSNDPWGRFNREWRSRSHASVIRFEEVVSDDFGGVDDQQDELWSLSSTDTRNNSPYPRDPPGNPVRLDLHSSDQLDNDGFSPDGDPHKAPDPWWWKVFVAGTV